MRLGLIADVHGNSVALRACLDKLSAMNPDRIYFLGDAVGYLPDAAGCLRLLDEAEAVSQRGNHEEMLLSASKVTGDSASVYRLDAAAEQLDSQMLARIRSWPLTRRVSVDSRHLLLVHGSPEDPLHGYVYADCQPERYADRAFDAIVMAHTHRPFVLDVDGVTLVNVGSVGLPRDVGNLSSFAVFDTETGRAVIYRVPFDVEELLSRWGAEIHEQTAACLKRTADRYEGELLT